MAKEKTKRQNWAVAKNTDIYFFVIFLLQLPKIHICRGD